MKYIIFILFLFLFIGCNVSTQKKKPVKVDTIYKDTTIYRTHYIDTTIYNISFQDSIVYLPLYLPEYLKNAVQSGNVKFTIRYR